VSGRTVKQLLRSQAPDPTWAEGRRRRIRCDIAATARRRGRTVVTADPSGFADLPQVEVRVLGADRQR
jgi:predicted nucleic acid-binding protein